jgi:hypothetical protein
MFGIDFTTITQKAIEIGGTKLDLPLWSIVMIVLLAVIVINNKI